MLPSRPSFRTLKPPEPFERLRAQEYGSPHPRDACRPCGCATSRPRSSLRSCAHLPAATLAATAPMPLHRHLPCVPPCPPSTFGPLIPTSWRTRGSSWSSRWRQGPAQDPMACRGGAKLRGSLQTAGTSGAGRVANRRGCLSRAVSPHPCLRLLGRPLDARLASLALPALHVLLRACACLIRCLPAAPSCSGSLSVVLPPCRRPPQGPPQWLAPGAVASSGAWGAWSCLCQGESRSSSSVCSSSHPAKPSTQLPHPILHTQVQVWVAGRWDCPTGTYQARVALDDGLCPVPAGILERERAPASEK